MQSNQQLKQITTSFIKSSLTNESLDSFPSYVYEQKQTEYSIDKLHKIIKNNLFENDTADILKNINETLITFPTVLINIIMNYLQTATNFGTVIIANLILIRNNQFFAHVFKEPENCAINIYLALNSLANGKSQLNLTTLKLKTLALNGKDALQVLEQESRYLTQNSDLLLGIDFLFEHYNKPTHSIKLTSLFKTVAENKITLNILPHEEKILEKEIGRRGLAISIAECKPPEKLSKILELLKIKYYTIKNKYSYFEVIVNLRDAHILQNIFQAQPLIAIIEEYLKTSSSENHTAAKKLALFITKNFIEDKVVIEKLQFKINQQITTTTDSAYSKMLRYLEDQLTRLTPNNNIHNYR